MLFNTVSTFRTKIAASSKYGTQQIFLCIIIALLVSGGHSAPTADSRQRFAELKLTAADNYHKRTSVGENSSTLGQAGETIAATEIVSICEIREYQDHESTWKSLSWSGLKAVSKSAWNWMRTEPIKLAKQVIATAVESAKKFSVWLFTSFRKITKTIGRGIKVGVGQAKKMSGYDLVKLGLSSLREVIDTVGTLKTLLSFVL